MPIVLSTSCNMEEGLIQDALDRFCSSHEQTYAEFLNTFTHLTKEDVEKKRGPTGAVESADEVSSGNTSMAAVGSAGQSTALLPAQNSEDEQLVLEEGLKTGSFKEGDLHLLGKIKVDNYMDCEDVESDEDVALESLRGAGLLPGETEHEVPLYTPSVLQHTQLSLRTDSGARQPQEEPETVRTDEVQPFSLDEGFDYDNVPFSLKYSRAELALLKGPPGGRGTSVDLSGTERGHS
uniref:Intraflagellar transport associated protein n=1 Tax=Latimeria chalumnae TaxID=7897 RepID=H3A6V2_LATCH